MKVVLTVVRYPTLFAWAGIKSMALFRPTLSRNARLSFYKLLGSGKNGSFDAVPDLKQWAIIATIKDDAYLPATNPAEVYGNFIMGWWKFFKAKQWTLVLEPLEGHGLWDKKKAFGQLPKTSEYDGPIAVLTRATIRPSRLRSFWRNVGIAAAPLASATGFIHSIGIGEVPWIKQATFSIWQNKQSMKDYAYKMKDHNEVIRKTRKENWYSEEMFVRFKVVAASGDLPQSLQQFASSPG